MSNESWTKGEWRVQIEQLTPTSNATGYTIVTDDYDVVSTNMAIRNESDAVVMAAAPDLYAALDKIARRIDANDVDEWTLHALKNIAWEALAKARGES